MYLARQILVVPFVPYLLVEQMLVIVRLVRRHRFQTHLFLHDVFVVRFQLLESALSQLHILLRGIRHVLHIFILLPQQLDIMLRGIRHMLHLFILLLQQLDILFRDIHNILHVFILVPQHSILILQQVNFLHLIMSLILDYFIYGNLHRHQFLLQDFIFPRMHSQGVFEFHFDSVQILSMGLGQVGFGGCDRFLGGRFGGVELTR
mmetsp:Transcript_6234/g.11153  ORF Transcript_6234/g.11153 Transcript_6234/m.11153 type:complete len:205 (-) Transcript_6234:669-1283(-)